MVKLERELMLGFYAVRKLLDTDKVTASSKQMRISLSWYPNIRFVNPINWHHIDKNYDFGIRGEERRDLRFVCDRFVHSYVFLPFEANGRFGGCFVATERDRNRRLYQISVEDIIGAFRTVGRDYPTEIHYGRDILRGDA